MFNKLFALIIGVLTVSSCTVSEDVIIRENGNVEFIQKMEFPELASFMGLASMEEKIEMNQISNQEFNYIDFIKQLENFETSVLPSNKNNQYSIYEEDLKAIDFLKFKLDLRDNFAFEFINRAKSVDEFNANSIIIDSTFARIKAKEDIRIKELQEKKALEEIGKKKKKKKKNDEFEEIDEPLFNQDEFSNFTNVTLSYDGNVFSKVIDSKKILEKLNDENYKTEDPAALEGMLKQVKYKIKYTFPKKIKSINYNDAMFSQDGKTFVKEFSVSDILKNPEILNLKVVLEN